MEKLMNDTQSFLVFLLGGYDLEMLTIKQMLEERDNCVIVDKHLQWDNAFLSAYKNELSQYADQEVYAIELHDDVPIPVNCHIIDHHGQREDNSTALEQVAELLGVTLNRYQQLVAANDRGYIPAMIAMSATQEEIDIIRKNDRQAQGVGQDDELKAEQSIATNMSKSGKLTIVHSMTRRFSCISDRLFPYHSLLIYDDSSWSFYGEGKTQLVAQLRKEIIQNKVYYGGGENGFIGCARNAYSHDEIFHFVEQIKNGYGYE